jgi:hypothetical protein
VFAILTGASCLSILSRRTHTRILPSESDIFSVARGLYATRPRTINSDQMFVNCFLFLPNAFNVACQGYKTAGETFLAFSNCRFGFFCSSIIVLNRELALSYPLEFLAFEKCVPINTKKKYCIIPAMSVFEVENTQLT